MEILKSLEDLFEMNTKDTDVVNGSIGSICDILEYSDASKEDVLSNLNILLDYLVTIENKDIQENILNAMLRVMEAKNIDSGLNLEMVINKMDIFNNECISYLLSFLAFSGKKEYRSIIENYLLDEELKEDAEEALIEIDYRIKAINEKN